MEVKALYGFTLGIVLVGMLLGVGILVFTNFEDAVQDLTTVTNESVTITTGAGQLTGADTVTLLSFYNYTHPMVVGLNVNSSSVGVISGGSNVSDGTWFAVYSYEKDSKATDVMQSMTDAVSPIASVWLSLIITVAILAIILTMVIRSFAGAR